jgi:hypothetical protein
MKSTVWTGACAVIVGLATTAMLAQTPAQTSTPQQSTPQTATPPTTTPQTGAAQPGAASSADQKITVTGCLKAAPQASSDTAPTPSPTGTTGVAGAAGTAGTAGTTGSTTSPATSTDQKFVLTSASATPADTANTAQTYRLIANPSALTAHVGKKLELTGTIDKSSAADPNDPSAAAPALRVESGKIVAASCEP